jgi:hypothetical protein
MDAPLPGLIAHSILELSGEIIECPSIIELDPLTVAIENFTEYPSRLKIELDESLGKILNS